MFAKGFRFIQKAAVFYPDEARILLLRRAAEDTYRPGDWDFPGGNVERGVLGGFTTFSAFSLDTALLYERGQLGAAAGYAGMSLGLSLVGVFGGLAVSRALFS